MPGFELIDFSLEYYSNLDGGAVPAVRGGKFVQIRNGNKEYLVLSNAELSKFHANIVARFCEQKGLSGRFTKPDKAHFELTASGWEVVGGGKWLVDEQEKSFRIYGSSLGYGEFDRRGLRDKVLSAEGMSGYDVRVVA